MHAVLRHWHSAGKPRHETGHSFREWCDSLNWIVQEVFKLPMLLEDHLGAVERVANPALGWLRQVALAVIAVGKNGHTLSAANIVDLCAERDIELPGLKDASEEQRKFHAGKLLGRAFRDGDRVTLDAVHVRRWERPWEDRPDKMLKLYQFYTGAEPPEPSPYAYGGHRG